MNPEEAKKIVMEYDELAFGKKDINAAAALIADDFKQHNPQVPDGKDGVVNGIGGYLLKNNPNLKVEVKRVISDGEFVVLHKFGTFDSTNTADRGMAIIDIFRVANGKIAEHWDVIQPIPEQSANGNTMF
jgi:predicted SnoaL-like aldol condensation-catalyzing enzyme